MMLKIDSKRLSIITLIYIYVPVVIFLCGFCAWYVWLLSIAACGFSFYRIYLRFKSDDSDTKDDVISVSLKMLIIGLIFIVTMCFVMGFWDVFEQSGDWSKHNAVLHDLVERSWPVVYTAHEKALLTYYLGQYMVPALFGKVFGNGDVILGFNISHMVMSFWALAGLCIAYLNLIKVTKSDRFGSQIRCLLIMFFYSGPLALCQIITNGIFEDDMYSLGSHHWLLIKGFMLQYRSDFVMLRWTYPQVIVIWLICMLFLQYRKDIRYYVLLFAPVLLYGAFSIPFLAIAAVSFVIYEFIKTKDKMFIVKEVLSVENIICFLTLGVTLITYFYGYMTVEKPDALKFHVRDINAYSIAVVLIFDLCMFGIYAICMFKDYKKDILFHCCLVFLTILPFFSMGLYNDLVMGASIPALFFMMTFVVKRFNKGKEGTYYGFTSGIITLCLLIGALYQLFEIRDIVRYKFIADDPSKVGIEDFFGTLETYTDRDSNESVDLIYNYFTYEPDEKFFYKYLSSDKKETKEATLGYNRVSGLYFDTYVDIKVYDDTTEEVLRSVLSECDRYEHIFSRTLEQSELYAINHRENDLNEDDAYTASISEDMYNVLVYALRLSEESNRSFNPALGAVTELWDFRGGSDYVPEKDIVDEALTHTNIDDVEVFTREEDGKLGYYIKIHDDKLKLDLGGIAKGYIGNCLRDKMIENGCKRAIISLGGNVVCIGDKNGQEYTIGVQKPFEKEGVREFGLSVSDTCVVTSGTYERYFEKDGKVYHHILDPKTGYPVLNGVLSVTVVCPDSMKADALSTALLSMGEDAARTYVNGQSDVYAVFLMEDGSRFDIWG